MKPLLLLSFLALTACGSALTAYATSTGTLPAGSTFAITSSGTQIDVYKPAIGQAPSTYTVVESAVPGSYPATRDLTMSPRSATLDVAPFYNQVLVRVPDRVALTIHATKGTLNVTDISGPSVVSTGDGEVKVMVPGYAQASSGNGNVTVFMGATQWPGTLHFSTTKGDAEVWVNATAQFRIRMHTEHGTIFTDFPVTGTSSGESETIDSVVGGGHPKQRIDIEVKDGGIRLLQLKPQV